MAPVMTITTEPKLRIIEDRLQGTQIQALLAEHVADMRSLSPPESTHTLDLERLRAADIRFWSVWRGETLVGCGALKHLSDDHAEIKSMRTPRALRGQGAGRAMLVHLIEQARALGYKRLSLETGAMAEFAPAHQLYRAHGFQECGPFADYGPDPLSVFMTLVLD